MKQVLTTGNTKDNVISLMSNCICCDKETMKQYHFGDAFLCKNCKDLTLNDIYLKLTEIVKHIIDDDPILKLDDCELHLLFNLNIKNEEKKE